MTAAASNVPISVDYTGRDYYAIREQLIKRVQERVPDWQGSDPNDFGLALVEAFSYMGDLVNFYIDRIANESYILTATQRETLLNIAATYGYKPASYVSSSTTLDITNSSQGYRGAIGGAILEDGDATHTLGNYAKIIVPNDHPFTADLVPAADKYNRIKVNSMPNETNPSTLGDRTFVYNTSVFNGTFPVVNVGYDNFGKNVVWYRPVATIATPGIVDSTETASVTAAVGDGTTVTYTANNTFATGDIVTITGLGTASGATLNLVNVLIDTATDTTFTVKTNVTGVSSGTGTAKVVSFVVTLSETNRTLTPYSGQKITLTGSTVGAGDNYNGKWVIASSTSYDSVTNTKATITIKPAVEGTIAVISAARVFGTSLQYAAWNDFVVGEKVTITGAATTSFNLSNVAVTGTKSIEGVVSRATITSTTATYYLSEQLAVGDYITVRQIQSVGNSLGTKDAGYNLTNKVITSVADTRTVTVSGVQGGLPGTGQITYESVAHGFEEGDYVTMTGIVNDPDGTVDATDVLNLKSAKILGVTDDTFWVEGYWMVEFAGSSGTPEATRYAATITEVITGNVQTSGKFVSEYFTVAKPGGFTDTSSTFTNGQATANIGGNWTSGGEVVYTEIPALVVSGPFVNNIGSTVVPKGTQVRTQVTVDGSIKDIVFSTMADTAVPYRETASVLALHGEDISLRAANAANTVAKPYDIAGELLGYSSGEADQTFALKEVQVDPRTVRVFIDTGTEWEEWTYVEYIQDYTPSSRVFEVKVSATEEVSVVFGDGISGYIPNREAGIKAVYIAGGGVEGNVAANSLTTWDTVLGTNATVIRTMKVTNQYAATGGANPESNDSIRYNAPRSLRAMNRAVTLDDFASLSLAIDGVVKTNAVASSRSSVSVYIAPNATGSSEETPGVDSDGNPTSQMENYKYLVAQYLEDKKQIGTTVTVLEPVYTKVQVDLKYSALPQYNQGTVATSINKAIVDKFSYDNVEFGDVITPEEVEFKIRQVEGVSNVKVTGLYREGGTGRNSLIGEPYEIFVFTEAGITSDTTSQESRVNTITFVPMDGADNTLAAAIVSPTVNGEVYSYTLSVPAGTEKLEINATALSEKASITINDNAVTLDDITFVGSYTSAITVGDTSNDVLVTITAEDGTSVSTYRFKVTVLA